MCARPWRRSAARSTRRRRPPCASGSRPSSRPGLRSWTRRRFRNSEHRGRAAQARVPKRQRGQEGPARAIFAQMITGDVGRQPGPRRRTRGSARSAAAKATAAAETIAVAATGESAAAARSATAAARTASRARDATSGDDLRLAGKEAFALRALAGQFAGPADRFRLFPRLLGGGLFVMSAELHLAEDALALHLFLERLEGLVDVVVANENLHD